MKTKEESGVLFNLLCLAIPGTTCKGIVERSQFVLGFCEACSFHYKRLGHNPNSEAEILNYWQFKRERGIKWLTPATLIPAEQVFGQPSPPELNPEQVFYEIGVLENLYEWKEGALLSRAVRLEYIAELRQATIDQAHPVTTKITSCQPKPIPRMTARFGGAPVRDSLELSTDSDNEVDKYDVESTPESLATETGDDVPASDPDIEASNAPSSPTVELQVRRSVPRKSMLPRPSPRTSSTPKERRVGKGVSASLVRVSKGGSRIPQAVPQRC
ncbi:hypothetical protein OQA88_6321 [Cercophora sp. LCS_1]